MPGFVYAKIVPIKNPALAIAKAKFTPVLSGLLEGVLGPVDDDVLRSSFVEANEGIGKLQDVVKEYTIDYCFDKETGVVLSSSTKTATKLEDSEDVWVSIETQVESTSFEPNAVVNQDELKLPS